MTDKKKPGPLSFEATLRTTLFTIFVIVTLGFGYQYLDLGIFGGPTIVRADMPDPVGIDKNEPFVAIDIPLYLENNTRNPMRLTVENPCYIMEWAVFRADGVFVQAMKSDDACSQMIMSASLDPGEATQDTLTVLLDPNRYEADEDYLMLIRYWGQEIKKNFTTVDSTLK